MQFLRRHDRGRPPHPDVLTPAEWRVLEHIRERRTNAEIAVRLGVSVNTVRTHVSSMLAKLDAADREELARWRGEPAAATRVALAGRRAPVAGPLGWLRERWASPAAKAIATGLGVTVMAVAIVGAASIASSMGEAIVEPTPAVADTPTEEPSEDPASTPDPPNATIGAPVSIDGEYIVVVVPNTASEMPPSHVERVTFERGSIQSRAAVLEPDSFGTEDSYLNTWRNPAYPPRSTGGAVMAAICLDGQAQCGGLGPADPAARTVLVRSLDHGATWEQLATLEGAYWVPSWSADASEAILWRFPTGAVNQPWELVRWPSMVALTRPVLLQGTAIPDRPPMLLADRSLAWWTAAGLVDEQGQLLLALASLGAPVGDMFEGSLSPDGERLVLTWNTPGSPRDASWHWTLFERNAAGRFEAMKTLVQPSELGVAVPYVWLDAKRVVIPANYGAVPAVLDFRTAEVSPLAGFDDADLSARGNLVIHNRRAVVRRRG